MRRLAITLLVAPFAGLVGLSLLGGAASASSPVGATVPPDSTASAGDAAADDDQIIMFAHVHLLSYFVFAMPAMFDFAHIRT